MDPRLLKNSKMKTDKNKKTVKTKKIKTKTDKKICYLHEQD